MAHRIPARLSPTEGRKFAFTVGTAFGLLAGLTWWREHQLEAAVLGSLGAGLWVMGLVIPGRLRPLYAAWMGLAHAISRVTTPIFMGVVFFGVIMPVGLVMRALGRNPVRHQPVDSSFWMARTEGRGGLRNQF